MRAELQDLWTMWENRIRSWPAAGAGLRSALTDLSPLLPLAEVQDAELSRLRAEMERLKADCASMSDEFGLPPTIRPAEGEIRRMLQERREAYAEVSRLTAALAAETRAVERLAGYMVTRNGCPPGIRIEELCPTREGMDCLHCWSAWARQPATEGRGETTGGSATISPPVPDDATDRASEPEKMEE